MAVVTLARVRRRLSGAGLLLLAATGCQGLADGTTRGPALLTLRGKITLAPNTTVDGNVRLALAWYPGLLNEPGGSEVPNCDFTTSLGIISQDVEYRPNFPIDYAFDVTAPPPIAAQAQIDGSAGINLAVGAVVAYLDGNKNGALDRCTDGAGCPDRVLGASGAVLPGGLPGDQIDSLVGYTDEISASPGDTVSQPAFFLLRLPVIPGSAGSAILPLPATPIDITLSDAPILKSIACERLCVQTVGEFCGPANATCVAPAWPKDTHVHCDGPSSSDPPTPRAIYWLGMEGCNVSNRVYVIEDERALPPWWPCP
jgi:hypothetical protein